MRKKLIRRKVWRQIDSSRKIGLTTPSDRFEGFGNVIIPIDMNRAQYIAMVYRQGECMIVTDYGDVIKQVKIPLHILQSLIFPKIEGERGSLVEWKRHAYSGVTTLTAIHISPGQYQTSNENVYQQIYGHHNFKFSTTTDTNSKSVSYVAKSSDERGELLIKASGLKNSYFQFLCDGNFNIHSDNKGQISVENSLTINVGSKKDTKSTITISQEGVLQYNDRYGNKISIIDGKMIFISPLYEFGTKVTDPAVLGDKLVDIIGQIIDAITSLTVTAQGSPSSTPINSATFTQIKDNLKNILSQVIKLQ